MLLVARSFAGEDGGRRAAPFLVLAPMALFVATTGDAVFMALAAWSIALLALAVDHGRLLLALAAGGAGATTLYFTYGLVPLLAALGVVVLWHGRRSPRRRSDRSSPPPSSARPPSWRRGRRPGSGGSTGSTSPTTSTACGPATTGRTATSWWPTWSCSR